MTASYEVAVRDAIGFVRVDCDAIFLGVGAVVEQDAAARDAVGRPVVDGGFVVGVRTDDVGAVGVVVECLGGDPGELRRLNYLVSELVSPWSLTPMRFFEYEHV